MKRSANHHAERCRELADILIVPLREVARRHGYALAVHGSLSYDIDLIACPWRELSTSPASLAEAIHKAIDAIAGTSKLEGPEQKPYGRLAWSIHMGGGPYVDLSVTPAQVTLTDEDIISAISCETHPVEGTYLAFIAEDEVQAVCRHIRRKLAGGGK